MGKLAIYLKSVLPILVIVKLPIAISAFSLLGNGMEIIIVTT